MVDDTEGGVNAAAVVCANSGVAGVGERPNAADGERDRRLDDD